MAALTSLPQPAWQLVWAGRDVTGSLAPWITTMRYTDSLQGQSDALEISLSNADNRFLAAWYPQKGDTLQLRYGYAHSQSAAIDFDIDEINFSGSPDTVSVKALSAGVRKSYRSRQGISYTNTTLKGLATAIAQKHGLQLVGSVPDVSIEHATQFGERDLEFLQRMAQRFGVDFAIKRGQLVMHAWSAQAQAVPALTLDKGDVTAYQFTDKLLGIARVAEVRYHDSRQKRTRKQVAPSGLAPADHSPDAVIVTARRGSNATLAHEAQTQMEASSRDRRTGSVSLPGDVRCAAGVLLNLTSFGVLDGRWLITEAAHQMDQVTGYTTQLELKQP